MQWSFLSGPFPYNRTLVVIGGVDTTHVATGEANDTRLGVKWYNVSDAESLAWRVSLYNLTFQETVVYSSTVTPIAHFNIEEDYILVPQSVFNQVKTIS